MIRNITVFLTLAALVAALYIIFPFKSSSSPGSAGEPAATEAEAKPFSTPPPGASLPPPTLTISVGTQTYTDVKVIRCDPEGFYIQSREGTLEIWNRDLTKDAYYKLKKASPTSTPTPVPTPIPAPAAGAGGLMRDHSIMGWTPTPTPHKRH